MPVTLVDRLPLPSLKVYSAGSVLALSAAVYHAVSATSAAGWRVNATQRPDGMEASAGDPTRLVPALAPLDVVNGTRNLTEQFSDIMTFMLHEQLCMWTLINMAYCSLAVFGFALQRLVFGPLRVAEAQRVKDKFWNYVFYKFIFVFGVVNVQYMDEVLLWCSWFTLVGFLHLLAQLCKDRFEYLSSSPMGSRWAHVRLATLLSAVASAAAALLLVAARLAFFVARDTFAFMAAECILVLLCSTHVLARYALHWKESDTVGPLSYYTHLFFDSVSLVVELVHVIHMVVYSNLVVSMPSLVLLMQLRHLLHELQARLRRHRLYTALAHHMSTNYPMASKEEVEKNEDNCAICWEPMKEARKLPCSHLFHNSCLCQWVQQDASCPTCRRALQAGAAPAPRPRPLALPLPLPLPRTLPLPLQRPRPADAAAPPAAGGGRSSNHLFHFDGSRYVSWLPSFSVEVTRVSTSLSAHQIDAMSAQVQAMFPAYARDVLAADLARTRSADATVENILEGRLAPPTAPASASEPTGQSILQGRSASAPASISEPPLTARLGYMSPPESEASPPSPPPPPRPPPAWTAPVSAQSSTPEVPPTPVPTLGSSPSIELPIHAYTVDDHRNALSQPSESAHSTRFSKLALEREATLRRRKEQLVAAARRRYLARRAAPAPAPAPPSDS